MTHEPYLDEEGNPLKFVGKQKMIDYIREHDEFRAEYEKVVNDYINHAKRDISLIDEEDLKAILEAEKGVEDTINNGIRTDEEEEEDDNKEEE